MIVTLSERFEIALSDPGKFRFSGCKYCACLIKAPPNGRLSFKYVATETKNLRHGLLKALFSEVGRRE